MKIWAILGIVFLLCFSLAFALNDFMTTEVQIPTTSSGTGTVTIGGSNTTIQFNDEGKLNGSGSLTFNKDNGNFVAGIGASTTGTSTITLGGSSTTSGASTIAIGDNALADGTQGLALGVSSVASGAESIGMGSSAQSYNIGGIAIGSSTTVLNDYGMAIGASSTAFGAYSLAIGYGALTNNDNEISIGNAIYTDIVTLNSYFMGSVGIGTATPDALLNVIGESRFGSATDYSSFETDGTLFFNNNATVWDDVYVPITVSKLGGTADPDWSVIRNTTYAYEFQDNLAAAEDRAYFTFQMPHSYKVNSQYDVHLHYSFDANTSGKAIFELECTEADIGGKFGYTTTYRVNLTTSGNDAFYHNMTDFGHHMTCGTVSCIKDCRIQRKSSYTADNYGTGVYLHAIDFHVEMDTIGSRGEVTK